MYNKEQIETILAAMKERGVIGPLTKDEANEILKQNA